MAHTTIMRWVHQYAPELDKRTRPHLNQTGDSWKVDETYVKIKGRWMYLYRAVDKQGATIDFYLSAHRDQLAAARFFKKALGADHNTVPRVINVDKNASYAPAVGSAKEVGYLPEETELRQVKYLNNRIECDHRRIKRLIRHGLGFKVLWTAHKTIRGYETMHMIRKGQVALSQGSHMEQVGSSKNLWTRSISLITRKDLLTSPGSCTKGKPSTELITRVSSLTESRKFSMSQSTGGLLRMIKTSKPFTGSLVSSVLPCYGRSRCDQEPCPHDRTWKTSHRLHCFEQ